MRRRRAAIGAPLAGAMLLAALLAGCSSVIDGTGSAAGVPAPGGPSASGTHDFPANSASASAPSAPANGSSAATSSAAAASGQCPTVAIPAARLTFPCIADGLTRSDGVLWTVQLVKPVDTSGWALEEGLAHVGSPAGKSLAQVAAYYRDRMVQGGAYLPNPKVATIANRATKIDGAPAHLLQTMLTLDTAQAVKRGTKVRQEQLWILAIQVGSDDVTVWHVSVPDLAKTLWPKVPDVIDSIKVG